MLRIDGLVTVEDVDARDVREAALGALARA
jgi:hypothetical protein